MNDMANIPAVKILEELSKLKEYEYPTEQSSVFLLPNGKMVGNDILFNHVKALEKIFRRKLNIEEALECLASLQIVNLNVDDSILYINILALATEKQKVVLKKLGKSNKYNDCVIDMYDYLTAKYVNDGELTMPYRYKLLGLPVPSCYILPQNMQKKSNV